MKTRVAMPPLRRQLVPPVLLVASGGCPQNSPWGAPKNIGGISESFPTKSRHYINPIETSQNPLGSMKNPMEESLGPLWPVDSAPHVATNRHRIMPRFLAQGHRVGVRGTAPPLFSDLAQQEGHVAVGALLR